ncbi:hypothetical protein [Pseudomonas monteilii]|uniref:hypothetical protein n=1 Tax=Pseudomonas monteilii TaxID=76759 RepID=UPI000761172B|nr:hypothetical protein [Pseudomonas monteilii]
MIKFNLDICTTRRLSGWIFNEDDQIPIDGIYLSHADKKTKIELIEREDVAQAFSLSNTKLGIEINIPDAFDGVVDDYSLYFESQEIFSYRQQYEKLINARTSLPSMILNSDNPNFGKGRHVIFLYEKEEHQKSLAAFLQPMVRRSFPKKIAGCEFSFEHIGNLSRIKDSLLGNLKNVIIVSPSDLYSTIQKTSPTLIESGRFITIFESGSLLSPTGLHEHQLNNFIMRKTSNSHELPLFTSSVARVWEAVENYADLIFKTTENLFFIIQSTGTPVDSFRYISNKIQSKRTEEIIRVRSKETEIILLNISAYSKMFDHIGDTDCWGVAIKRGLKHLDLVI